MSEPQKPDNIETRVSDEIASPSTTDTNNDNNETANFLTDALRHVAVATRSCNAFPQGDEHSLLLTYPDYSRMIEDQTQRVLGLVGTMLRSQQLRGDIQRRQLDEQYEMVQECNDILFERINTSLDQKAALRRNQHHLMLETQVDVMNNSSSSSSGGGTGGTTNTEPSSSTGSQLAPKTATTAGSWNRTQNTPPRNVVSARLFTAKNIKRPQMQFKVPVDNSDQTPFVPRLQEKPNSLKPLALLPEYDEAGNIASYLHPYEFELLKLEPNATQLKTKEPKLPTDLAETELLVVDTLDKLKEALEELQQAKEIAIDVEHHSYRTFMGITCLVQMSTRHKDYIFDTLALREDMHQLNLVLTDPKVLKVFHGADMDIEWLQRDLSLYIVNMFDTYRAAKALNMARLSLAFLLKHYLNLDVDKSFQLADWRMRPLPNELIAYARQDTHYLLYIYDLLTNDLLELEHGKPHTLRAVYQLSTEVCKKRYFKPHIGPESHLDLVRKTKRAFDNRQLCALRGIFAWRDTTARQEDESYGYVLPNHMMLQIAESLPREVQGILACCNPIPPLVRQHLHILHQIVLRARDQPLVKPVLETRNVVLLPTTSTSTRDFNSKLYCPHDFSHVDETRDDLPTLLKRSASGKLQPVRVTPIATLSLRPPELKVFEKPPQPTAEDELRWSRARNERLAMCMPYKRYLAILPLMEQLQQDQAARERNMLLKRRLCPAAPPPNPEEDSIKLDADIAAATTSNLSLKQQLKRKPEPKDEGPGPSAPKRTKPNENMTPTTSTTTPMTTESKEHVTIEIDSESDSDSDDDVKEVPIGRKEPQSASTSNRQAKKRRQKYQFKSKGGGGGGGRGGKKFQTESQARQLAQSSGLAVPKREPVENFNYKNVDFRKFQGGGQRTHGADIKPQIRGKNRPNNRDNKKFNKLFTFSNVKKPGFI